MIELQSDLLSIFGPTIEFTYHGTKKIFSMQICDITYTENLITKP